MFLTSSMFPGGLLTVQGSGSIVSNLALSQSASLIFSASSSSTCISDLIISDGSVLRILSSVVFNGNCGSQGSSAAFFIGEPLSSSAYNAQQQGQVIVASTGTITTSSSGTLNAHAAVFGQVAILGGCTLTLAQVN